jgi:ASC-1-like (ASCH) protein
MTNNIHYLSICNPIECPTFSHIKSGLKTVEGRKYSLKYQVGDIIEFTNIDGNNEKILTKVVAIRCYETLEKYLKKETFQKVLPGINSMSDAIALYNTWSSPIQREELRVMHSYSFVAIEILVIL